MLRLLVRRALAQLPLLAAILGVVVIGATALGVCALLLTSAQDRALDRGMAGAAADDVDATVFLSDVKAGEAAQLAASARSAVTSALTPFRSSTRTQASTSIRVITGAAGATRVGYLSGFTDPAARAELTAGRWPVSAGRPGPLQAAVLGTTARRLGLTVGSRVRLGGEITNQSRPAVSVVIVGLLQPRPGTGWDRDLLGAAGYDPAYPDGTGRRLPAYGPFVVDLPDLFASGSTIERLQVSAHPDLSAPSSAALKQAAAALGRGPGLSDAADPGQIAQVSSDLPATLARAEAQLAITRSTVLVAVLLVAVLTASALALAGRLLGALRTTESALLSALGAGPGQLVVAAVVEAGVLAALAVALALPLSSLGYAALTHLPAPAGAGLAASPALTGAQVSAVVLGALLLAAVLVGPALRADPAQAGPTRGRIGVLTRSGADLALLALAVAGWWQLRAQPATAIGPDAVRVLAPVVCLLAGAVAAVRLLGAPLRAGEQLVRRSRGLVLPLAVLEAARRPQALAAALLLALAAATGSFALAFGATWQQSQHDQADLRVGTGLALGLSVPATDAQAAAISTAAGATAAPVTARGVAIGSWLGGPEGPTRLVAIDTTHAGTLLRGRPPAGTSWARVGAALGPQGPVAGLALPAGPNPALSLTGDSPRGAHLRVVPRLVLQGPSGLRTACTAAAVPLDGRAHRLPLCEAGGPGARLVAFALEIAASPTAAAGPHPGPAELAIGVRVPAAPGTEPDPAGAAWEAAAVGDNTKPVKALRSTVWATSDALILQTTATVDLSGLGYAPVEAMVTGFSPPAAVPVVLSDQLLQTLAVKVGDRLNVTVGATAVAAVVAKAVPTVPSAPGDDAVLADVDLLSRALIGAGDLDPPVDAWWVGAPARPDAAARTAGLGLGQVETRADVSAQLTSGPLRVGLPLALTVLVLAAVLLALAGLLLQISSETEARAVAMVRLRGLGLSRRSVRRSLLIQHGGVPALLIAAGAATGALAAWALGPPLNRSDLGTAPVPAALVHWPWTAELGLLTGLVLAGIAVVALVITVQLHRPETARLRQAE